MLKKLWDNILWIASFIAFIFVAIVYLSRGKLDKITEEYNERVNKNRGRRDEVKDQERQVEQDRDDAEFRLNDLKDKEERLNEKLEDSKESRENKDDPDDVIDDFQNKYGA